MAWDFHKKRPQGRRKRVIVIAAEGEITEPQYFQILNSMSSTTFFFVVENLGNGSDPRAVLARMKKYLRDNPLEAGNEAWIVIDQDRWSDRSFGEVREWVDNAPNRHCAVSIRRFEDWLKLHADTNELKKKYHSFLIGKDKHIPNGFLTKERVCSAIKKAKSLHLTEGSVGNVFEVLESFFK